LAQTTGDPVISDSYSESNQNTFFEVGDTSLKYGQSFTGDGGTLNSVKFYLKKFTLPTGNATAEIYAHIGTYGISSKGTGLSLATSESLDVSTLTTSLQIITFNFVGINKISLTNGTYYVVVVSYSEGNGSNYIDIGADDSSPTHSGNSTAYTGISWGTGSEDICFYVYKDGSVVNRTLATGRTLASGRGLAGS